MIEGLDRSGKTTQVKRLCDALYADGFNIKPLRFPGTTISFMCYWISRIMLIKLDRTTPIGQKINSYLQSETHMDDHSIHLLFSANRWEKAKWIRDTIAEGYTIICDRYVYSGMIYSAAKNNPHLSLEWARHCDEGLPRPDMVIFLDLELEEVEKRGGFGQEKYEKRELQERVKQLFLALKHAQGDEVEDMEVLDAGHSIEKVAEAVWWQAVTRIQAVESGCFRELQVVRPWQQGIVQKIPELRKMVHGEAE